jgi:hypothetical protein
MLEKRHPRFRGRAAVFHAQGHVYAVLGSPRLAPDEYVTYTTLAKYAIDSYAIGLDGISQVDRAGAAAAEKAIFALHLSDLGKRASPNLVLAWVQACRGDGSRPYPFPLPVFNVGRVIRQAVFPAARTL